MIPSQVELKLKYKFRLILDETWSYGTLGRTGGGATEAQNVDASEVDMIIGSLSGPLCAAGGFCAGNEEVVEHQRISSASYTYSAALPALLSTTASETISLLQEQPTILEGLRENVKAMRAMLDPRSDWVRCSSSADNPVLLLVLKDEVIDSKHLSIDDQNQIFREVVDEVCFSPSTLSLIFLLSPTYCFVLSLRGPAVSSQQRPNNASKILPSRSWSQPTRCRLAA
jgi:serine palmitoyltransferase